MLYRVEQQISYFYQLLSAVNIKLVDIEELQWNLAKRGMKISDPIFPIEMDLAKRGINIKN